MLYKFLKDVEDAQARKDVVERLRKAQQDGQPSRKRKTVNWASNKDAVGTASAVPEDSVTATIRLGEPFFVFFVFFFV
jgi:hypothetical protein